jgi:hypothetical protein
MVTEVNGLNPHVGTVDQKRAAKGTRGGMKGQVGHLPLDQHGGQLERVGGCFTGREVWEVLQRITGSGVVHNRAQGSGAAHN